MRDKTGQVMSSNEDFAMTAGIDALASRVRDIHDQDPGLVLAITGSVASGKSTLARHLEQSLEPTPAQIVSTNSQAIVEIRFLRKTNKCTFTWVP